jgi:hypothetical protein
MSEGIRRSIKHLKALTKFKLTELGIIADLKRPALAVWIANGRVPDGLLDTMAKGSKGKSTTVNIEGKDLPVMMGFALELAKDSFVWPKLVDGADPESDDELEPGSIPLSDLSDFLSWALGGQVQTETGTVSAEALGSFRSDEQLPRGRAHGRKVRPAPGASAGNP